jgi:molecular chaperone GrpE
VQGQGDTTRAAPAEDRDDRGPDARTAELEAQIGELEDRWRRALADLDNLRKRFDREVARSRSDERARVVGAWLPVADHLDLALAHAQADPASVAQGVEAVRDEAQSVLSLLGYTRVDEAGVPFDPARHEAISTETSAEVEPGQVVRVVRPGYQGDHSQLRPASVVVSAGTG